ncbi:MAG: RDD family protein [Deltaproteobacteria bacterium]|nr:RDD family protein [Deltaproteobacteria bacterium]
MIDTVHAVQTPEGVDLALRVAGPVPRALAWGVDTLLQGGIALALQVAFAGFAGLGTGLYLIGLFALLWFYPVLFEVRAHGQTPGKRLLGLRVLQENGTPVGWSASVLRNFLLVADFLPALYLAGLASMLADASFRRLGDLAAGTLVVHTDTPRARLTPIPEVTPLAPDFPLGLEEQAAVIAFAERAGSLSAERAAELAAIPRSLVGDSDPRSRLIAHAAYLVGRRA